MPKRSWRSKKEVRCLQVQKEGNSVQSLVSTELCDLTDEETRTP